MNEQAVLLQRMVQKYQPNQHRPTVQWLLHTCTVGFDLRAMTRACEQVLGEMGWETMSQMAERLHMADDGTMRPKAFVAATTTDEIQLERLTGTPHLIFVLDTTPASLIKTYRQIKTLVGHRHEMQSRIGLLFVPPIDGGRERLLLSCQRFLDFRPQDLGATSSSYVRSAVKDGLSDQQAKLAQLDAEAVAAWRPFVRRCLSQF